MCWRWERAKGTDLPDGARKQLQKCPITLVLEGEQAPRVILPLEFGVQLLYGVIRKAGGEELGGGVDLAVGGLSPDRSRCVLGLPLALQQWFSLSYSD